MDIDPGSTTAVIAYVRRRVTPTVLWSAIGALVTALVVTITGVVTMQSDIKGLKDEKAESRKERERFEEFMRKSEIHDAVTEGKLDNIADQLGQLRKWQDHVQQVADTPPRRRH